MTRCPAPSTSCAKHPWSAWQNRLQDTEESCTVRHHIIKDAHLALEGFDALLDFATSGKLGRHKIHCRSDDHQLRHLGGLRTAHCDSRSCSKRHGSAQTSAKCDHQSISCVSLRSEKNQCHESQVRPIWETTVRRAMSKLPSERWLQKLHHQDLSTKFLQGNTSSAYYV